MSTDRPHGADPYDPRAEAEGTGPLLVFVPGMDGTGSLFYRQAPRLARRYRVVTYRLRDDARSMDELVEDLYQLILRQGGPDARATLVGESFGGTLALSFALAHATRLDALVVVNSFPYFRPLVRLRLAIAGISVIPWGSMQLVRRLTAFRMHSKFTQPAELRRFLQLTRQTTKQGYLSRLRILTRYDVRERLSEIRTPTLFLASELDHLVPAVEQARLMAGRMPDARVQVLTGHGHICMIAANFDLDAILAAWAGRPHDPAIAG
jgi:pimeloyl-ACP methyl ester carboxylesterase